MFSPQEELAVSEAALKANMQRLMRAPDDGGTHPLRHTTG